MYWKAFRMGRGEIEACTIIFLEVRAFENLTKVAVTGGGGVSWISWEGDSLCQGYVKRRKSIRTLCKESHIPDRKEKEAK